MSDRDYGKLAAALASARPLSAFTLPDDVSEFVARKRALELANEILDEPKDPRTRDAHTTLAKRLEQVLVRLADPEAAFCLVASHRLDRNADDVKVKEHFDLEFLKSRAPAIVWKTTPSSDPRRKEERVPASGLVSVIDIAGKRTYAFLDDISSSGMKLEGRCRFAKGNRVRVEISFVDGERVSGDAQITWRATDHFGLVWFRSKDSTSTEVKREIQKQKEKCLFWANRALRESPNNPKAIATAFQARFFFSALASDRADAYNAFKEATKDVAHPEYALALAKVGLSLDKPRSTARHIRQAREHAKGDVRVRSLEAVLMLLEEKSGTHRKPTVFSRLAAYLGIA